MALLEDLLVSFRKTILLALPRLEHGRRSQAEATLVYRVAVLRAQVKAINGLLVSKGVCTQGELLVTQVVELQNEIAAWEATLSSDLAPPSPGT